MVGVYKAIPGSIRWNGMGRGGLPAQEAFDLSCDYFEAVPNGDAAAGISRGMKDGFLMPSLQREVWCMPVLGSYIVETWMLFHHHGWAEKATIWSLSHRKRDSVQRHPESGSVRLLIRLWKLPALGVTLYTVLTESQEAPGHANRKDWWDCLSRSVTSAFSLALCHCLMTQCDR